MKKNNNLVVILLVAVILFCVFYLGAMLENSRLYRAECTRLGGSAQFSSCYFKGAFDLSLKTRLDRSCPNPVKTWYLFNDANTRWEHKCG